MVFQLTEEIGFPDPRLGEPDGLFAVGGDLSLDRLILAYSYGIFPWFAWRQGQIQWFCPMKRFVIFPGEIHVSHSMRTLLRKEKYTVSINKDFPQVIRCCSTVDSRDENEYAWLGEDMIQAYTRLHEKGFAASVEVWEGERLVGGLYGVTIGHGFIGESMFSLVPNGSKVALIYLAAFLHSNGGSIIDCQIENPYLKSMGGRYIDYDRYLELLHGERRA
ncbi:MAG: leucyl/phenylalanyl-tRNA--protein transferase [Prevotella sp.]|nr:leucyl/phenylalanyl-tRNA--protein transferase [Prevotella sp.]